MIREEQTEIGLAKGKQENIYQNAVIVAYGMLIIMAVFICDKCDNCGEGDYTANNFL